MRILTKELRGDEDDVRSQRSHFSHDTEIRNFSYDFREDSARSNNGKLKPYNKMKNHKSVILDFEDQKWNMYDKKLHKVTKSVIGEEKYENSSSESIAEKKSMRSVNISIKMDNLSDDNKKSVSSDSNKKVVYLDIDSIDRENYNVDPISKDTYNPIKFNNLISKENEISNIGVIRFQNSLTIFNNNKFDNDQDSESDRSIKNDKIKIDIGSISDDVEKPYFIYDKITKNKIDFEDNPISDCDDDMDENTDIPPKLYHFMTNSSTLYNSGTTEIVEERNAREKEVRVFSQESDPEREESYCDTSEPVLCGECSYWCF